ncbi:MAG: phage Gp37/Gp68 family protein [Bacteroidia bacterium]|nr:phage Gp37/Gp68 family protein [Bacteroidia bacterium]
MASQSTIEWTEVTWNPVTGCTKISQGCKFCYAERMAKRLKAMGVEQYKDGFKVRLAPQVLETPLSWKKPRTVFVNSMSDLFQEEVPLWYIQDVFDIMRRTPQHTYQVLTKRSERLKELSSELHWSPNIWMGVSVEDERVAFRIEDLKACGAKVKFLSVEPLIKPLYTLPLNGIDWVIVGGESGPKARPMKKEWVDIVHQKCKELEVPFFFKQWGKPKFNSNPMDPTIQKDHPKHAKGGCQLDGKVYREMPERHALMK